MKLRNKQAISIVPITDAQEIIGLCVISKEAAERTSKTPISKRYGYDEGVGQLCSKCYADTYFRSND